MYVDDLHNRKVCVNKHAKGDNTCRNQARLSLLPPIKSEEKRLHVTAAGLTDYWGRMLPFIIAFRTKEQPVVR